MITTEKVAKLLEGYCQNVGEEQKYLNYFGITNYAVKEVIFKNLFEFLANLKDEQKKFGGTFGVWFRSGERKEVIRVWSEIIADNIAIG